MKRDVQIYIEGKRLELFNDEQINVNSTIQNINDISKVFTDFSQSFSVPASPYNNSIFNHFYNNDVDGNFDYRIRHDANIEIDLMPFRTGKIQLEKAQLKNGVVESYQVTFYGDVRTLKDLFGEDKLKDLNYSAYEHLYTGAEVKLRVEDGVTDYDVCYPLISSFRLWSYDDATSTDINSVAGGIKFTELFPALKVFRIFEEIENKYGVTFLGAFKETDRFKKLFLYLKNRETVTGLTVSGLTETQIVDINTGVAPQYFNNGNDTLNIYYFTPPTTSPVSKHFVDLVVENTTNSETYYIDIVVNGQLVNTITGFDNSTFTNVLEYNNTAGLNNIVSFYVRATNQINFNVNIVYKIQTWQNTEPVYDTYTAVCSTQILTLNVNLKNLMPDIKVSDFFSGILKEFNLTCYGVNSLTFNIEPLDDWYQKGAVIDVTKYTDVKDIGVDRIKLYKKISFEHEKSESFLNRQFFDLFGREYGSLNQGFPYDGEEYVVKVPFENILFQRFTDTDTQVAYCLTKFPDYKSYIPKPILLYKQEQKATSIKFKDEIDTDTIFTYATFGQDALINDMNYSLNWGSDTSSLLNIPVVNSLYASYYFGYINNLFDIKNRLTTVKCVLPISLLTTLRLNDKLVIRDKRYFINEMKTSLTTGETTFTLLNDLRDVINGQVDVSSKNQCIQYPVLVGRFDYNGFPLQFSSIELSCENPAVTISPSFFTQDGVATICIPSNPNVDAERVTETDIPRITESGDIRITEQAVSTAITIILNITTLVGATFQLEYIVQTP